MAILTKAQLEALNQSSFPDNSAEAITPAILRNYNTQTIDTLVDSLDTGSFTTDVSALNAFTASQLNINSGLNASTASQQVSINALNTNSGSVNSSITQLNASSASQQISINSLNAATSSYATSAITASSLITASVSGQTMTFTKGNGTTFDVTLPAGGSGSVINTGSFATTGSNTFNGNQTLQSGYIQWPNGFNIQGNVGDITNLSAGTSIQFITEPPAGPGGVNDIKFINRVSGSSIIFENTQGGVGNRIDLTGGEIRLNAAAASGSNGRITIGSNTTQINASNIPLLVGSFTASLQQGHVFVGNASGITTTVATSSFGTPIPAGTVSSSAQITALGFVSGSYETTGRDIVSSSAQITALGFISSSTAIPAGTISGSSQITDLGFVSSSVTASSLITASFSGNTLTFTKGDASTFGVVIPDISGSTIDTGSFATTGSNVFTGDQTFIDSANNFFTITDTSGSMMLVAKSYTSASAHITSSVNQLNLIFKANGSTGETILSGSNNIFGNQNTPTTGFRKYVTNANLGLSGNVLPQFSSSMAFSPTVSSNIFANQNNAAMTVRGPVSSSTYNISANAFIGGQINLGTSATLTYERAINGTTVGNNIVNGTVSVTAYKTNFISSSAMTISSNNIGGAVTLNADSSSITLAGNTIQNSSFRVDNSYFNSSATGGGASLSIQQGNGIFGANTTVFASGSNTTAATGRQFTANLLAGTFNSASVNLNGDNSNMFATAIIGHGLNVTGSSALQTAAPVRTNSYGSAFFGRFNAEDGNRARTAETVFAIGTGTTTTPKTGFLIDSGSNTFIEGTLNVSGSTTITGSLSVTNLIVSGSTQFNVGAFNSTITQSGSSAVSQSMTFNNTDITQGVSVVDTTKLTIANSGTYNIQFSAQLLADTGADTVWIWLKQNGTNVSNTATKLVLANNEANVAAWNFVVPATANDYFELVWQNNGGHTKLLYEVASGNYPAIPSVIATVTQVR
jgi:hypothetical protein